jgi:thiaminase/transcriptional activator TenA
VIGYAEIAARLAQHPKATDVGNPYRIWISEYAGDAYQEIAATARTQLDSLAERYLTPQRETELVAIFREATRLEADFWEVGSRMGERG